MAYAKSNRRNHPLGRNPTRHRVRLYDSIGPGTHPCHWCGKPVAWEIAYPAPGSLVVDHLDENKRNNAIENLVPACQPCNIGRTVSRLHAEGHYDQAREWTRQHRARKAQQLDLHGDEGAHVSVEPPGRHQPVAAGQQVGAVNVGDAAARTDAQMVRADALGQRAEHHA